MEISVNGLINLTTRPEKHVYFTYFFYSITFISDFCGEMWWKKICLYCKQWNLIHILSNVNQSILVFLSLSFRDTEQLILTFIPEQSNWY